MSLSELGIQHRHLPETRIASTRFALQARADLPAALERLAKAVPAHAIAGPPFAIFHFVSSVVDGSDVELGYPVSEAVETAQVQTRVLPAMEVLSLRHSGWITRAGWTRRSPAPEGRRGQVSPRPFSITSPRRCFIMAALICFADSIACCSSHSRASR